MARKKSNQKKSVQGKASVLTAIVIVVAVAIGLYFALSSAVPPQDNGVPKDDYSLYNKYKFSKSSSGYWQTSVKTQYGDMSIEFHYHPKDLENRTWNATLNTRLIEAQRAGANMYITFSPELSNQGSAGVAAVEVAKITWNVFGFKTKSAFSSEENLPQAGFTIIDCGNSSVETFVVKLQLGETDEVISEGYCAIIQSTTAEGLVPLADLFVYKTIGVMNVER